MSSRSSTTGCWTPSRGCRTSADQQKARPRRGGLAPTPRMDLSPHAWGTVSALELAVGDLAAAVLLPDIDDVVEAGDVALLVIGDIADHRLELHAGVHLFRDLLGI